MQFKYYSDLKLQQQINILYRKLTATLRICLPANQCNMSIIFVKILVLYSAKEINNQIFITQKI